MFYYPQESTTYQRECIDQEAHDAYLEQLDYEADAYQRKLARCRAKREYDAWLQSPEGDSSVEFRYWCWDNGMYEID